MGGHVVVNSSSADSADDLVPITPDDDTDQGTFRGFSFAVDGAITLITGAGNTRTIPSGSLAVGVCHACKFTRVLDTGTDATGILGWT